MFLSANRCPLRRNMRELNPGRPGLSRKRAEMPLEVLLDTVEERTARRLIDQAGTILSGLHGDMPENFAAQLVSRAAPEDLVRYAAAETADRGNERRVELRERQ